MNFSFVILYLFFRNKLGIWGWRSDRVEVVNGYEVKVLRFTIWMYKEIKVWCLFFNYYALFYFLINCGKR